MIKGLKQAIYPKVSEYFCHTIIAEGILKGSDQTFRCLFADNSLYNEYMSAMMYASPPCILSKRRIWIPSLKKMVKNPQLRLDLCIAVLPRRYEPLFLGLYDFKGQKLVRQVVDTSGSWENIRGRFHKTKRAFSNSVDRLGFRSRISNDLKDFDFFYNRMFIPHVSRKFRNISIIDSYEEMKKLFLKGFLLVVERGEQPVAAKLCSVEDMTLVARRSGVLDGDEKQIKSGAQSAMNYFQVRLAKDLNLRNVDTINSPACLNDGIYRHKREWGAAVYPDERADTWVFFFIPERSEKVVRFFEQIPVIIHTEQGLKGVVGLDSGTDLSSEKKKKLIDKFYAPGLEGLILFTSPSDVPLELAWNDLHDAGNHN